MILSGLRVFDIRDPAHPREIAYFNAPVTPRIIPPAGVNPPPSNWAMSSPSFVPQRNEIWYSDGLSGFYAVRLTNRAARIAEGRRRLAGAPLPRQALAHRPAQHRPDPARASPASGCARCPFSRCARRGLPSRYCVRDTIGGVVAVFRRGRVAAVITTGRLHGNRGVRVGSTVRRMKRAFPRSVGIGHAVYRANPHSPRLIGTRRRRVSFFAVASPRFLAHPGALSRELHR